MSRHLNETANDQVHQQFDLSVPFLVLISETWSWERMTVSVEKMMMMARERRKRFDDYDDDDDDGITSSFPFGM